MSATPPVVPQSAIERAARAMSERRAELIAQPVARIYGELFVAALQSLGDEWCLVPREPTKEMIIAGCENNPTAWNDGTDDGFPEDVACDVY